MERIPIGIDAEPQSREVALLPAEPALAVRDEAQLEVAEDAQPVPGPGAIAEADDGAEYVTISVPKAFWGNRSARAP